MGPRHLVQLVPLVLTALLACAPAQTYPGPERPRSEVALLRDTSNASVFAIDGARVLGGVWSLLPGRHGIWLRVRVFTRAPNVQWTAWTWCATVLEARAGEEYVARVRTREETESGLRERVEMEVGIEDSAGDLRALASHCRATKPDLGD